MSKEKINVSDEFKKDALAFTQKYDLQGNFFKRIAEITANQPGQSRTKVMEGFDDVPEPQHDNHEVLQEEEIPEDEINYDDTKPQTWENVDYELDSLKKTLERQGMPEDKINRLMEIKKLSSAREDDTNSISPAENDQVIQQVQYRINSKNNVHHEMLEEQYAKMKNMAKQYNKYGKAFDDVCKKHKDDMGHPDVIKASDAWENYGERYYNQIYNVSKAMRKCYDNGVPFDDVSKKVKHDIEKGEFDQFKGIGPSPIDKLSRMIAERITKLLNICKRMLGIKNKPQQEVQAEQNTSKPSSTPTI